jgi:hypothetical protein
MVKWETFDVRASIKIIRHISAGIYRNPANAMKELIINAFDVGARKVDVTLDGPTRVSRIEISDNGQGMTEDDMLFSFQHVGTSIKKLDPKKFPRQYDRPLVGQFGIGLFAAAHASKRIKIETVPKGQDYALEIELDLQPFFDFEKQMETLEEFTYGSVRYTRKEKGNRESGTKLILSRAGEEPESKRFWDTINRDGTGFFHREQLRNDSSKVLFEKFMEWLDSERSPFTVTDLRGYEEFLWGLGLLLPVQYVADGPIRSSFLKQLKGEHGPVVRIIQRLKERLRMYNFHVFVDGVELNRPILLPTNIDDYQEELSMGDWKVYPISFKKQTAEAEGYLFHQPYRVRPVELRGILPRLHNVGIGEYDSTFFRKARKNPVIEYQVSGELFLESGFDDALNLDRGGIIETDAAYMALMENLASELAESDDAIFKQIKRAGSTRSKRQRTERRAKQEQLNLKSIEDATSNFLPKFEVKSVDESEARKLKQVDSDYEAVKISYRDKYVAVSSDAVDDPLVVKILLAIEKVLRENGVSENVMNKVRAAVKGVFLSYKHGSHAQTELSTE